MDSTRIEPFQLPFDEVEDLAEKQVEALLNQIVSDLKRIEHTLSGDDSPLINCWDEICVQQQSERFFSWEAYEMTIEGVIAGCFDALAPEQQRYVSFAAVNQAGDVDVPEYAGIYVDEVTQYLYREVLQLATNDTNPRIEAYLGTYSDFADKTTHNPDEYLLLRIDPAKRDDFLAALSLYGFVRHIEIDDEAVPLLTELLDNLDLPDNE